MTDFSTWIERNRWDVPQESDRLFNQDATCIGDSARLNYGVSPAYLYATGYREAARIVAKYACESRNDKDVLVFPVAYLYRHHVELVLKDLKSTALYLTDRTQSDRPNHELMPLWNDLRPLLQEVEAFPKEELDGVTAYVQQLHEIDPKGEAFKFSTTKNGKPLLADKTQIHIRTLAEAMEKLASYLDFIGSRLELLSDRKAETEGYKAEIEGGTDSSVESLK